MGQWRKPVGTVICSTALIVWIVAGVAASFAAARMLEKHLQGIIAAILLLGGVTSVGGLVIFWALADEIDFWRLGYRVRRLGPQEYFRWTLGPKSYAYEERGEDGRIQSLSFVRVVLGDGYPAESELRFPSEDTWDAQVSAWARGRRSQIVGRVRDLLGPSARVS